MLSYKKLFMLDTPFGKLVTSPYMPTRWTLKDNFYHLEVDPASMEDEPMKPPNWARNGNTITFTFLPSITQNRVGIHSLKSKGDVQLNGYLGSLVELSIGGKVIEGERGYRSSEASVVNIISDGKESVPSFFKMLANSDMLILKNKFAESIGKEMVSFLIDECGKQDQDILFYYYKMRRCYGTIRADYIGQCADRYFSDKWQYGERPNYLVPDEILHINWGNWQGGNTQWTLANP